MSLGFRCVKEDRYNDLTIPSERLSTPGHPHRLTSTLFLKACPFFLEDASWALLLGSIDRRVVGIERGVIKGATVGSEEGPHGST